MLDSFCGTWGAGAVRLLALAVEEEEGMWSGRNQFGEVGVPIVL